MKGQLEAARLEKLADAVPAFATREGLTLDPRELPRSDDQGREWSTDRYARSADPNLPSRLLARDATSTRHEKRADGSYQIATGSPAWGEILIDSRWGEFGECGAHPAASYRLAWRASGDPVVIREHEDVHWQHVSECGSCWVGCAIQSGASWNALALPVWAGTDVPVLDLPVPTDRLDIGCEHEKRPE